MPFSKEDFVGFLIDNNVVGFFPEGRKLKSGRISHWYANCRTVCDTAGPLGMLAECVLDFTAGLGIAFNYYFGVPEGCTKIAILCNYFKSRRESDPDQPVVMGRGKPKDHGDPKDRFFIGNVNEGDRITVIEDVTTTGRSMLNTVQQLTSMGAVPAAVIAFVNRMERGDDGSTVEDKMKEIDVPYYAMTTAEDLLKAYIKKEQPDKELIKKIEKDFKEYGIEPLRFDC